MADISTDLCIVGGGPANIRAGPMAEGGAIHCFAARAIGLGFRPEHVHSPEVGREA